MKVLTRFELWEAVVCPMQATSIRDRKYGKVPHAIAEEAYKEYQARYGNSQSLGEINRRGGMSDIEIIDFLYARTQRLHAPDPRVEALEKEIARTDETNRRLNATICRLVDYNDKLVAALKPALELLDDMLDEANNFDDERSVWATAHDALAEFEKETKNG